jgi:HK97 family phage major capsid protein
MTDNLKEVVEDVGRAFEDFKAANDARLKSLESKGSADVLIKDKLDRINDRFDAFDAEVAEVRKVQNRSKLNGAEGKDGLSADEREHRKAMDRYLRKGIDTGLMELQTKTMQVQSEPDGGYLVTPTRMQTILENIVETSPVRQVASVITIGTDLFEQPRRSSRGSTGGWVTESASRTATTSPQLGLLRIATHEIYAAPQATQKLLDDAFIDVEAWLAGEIMAEYSFLENTAFVNGTGAGQPRGFLTYASGTSDGQIEQVGSGTSGVVTADGIIKLQSALKEFYDPGAVFMMNRLVKRDVRLLKDSQNRYLWEPGSYQSLPNGIPDTLLGKPVYTASDMPTSAANALAIVYGDFSKGYKIVDRMGIRVLRDPFTAKPNIQFYSTKRVGADVAIFEALKIQKLA